jgi:hypothetical protein
MGATPRAGGRLLLPRYLVPDISPFPYRAHGYTMGMEVPPAPMPEKKASWLHSPASLVTSFLFVGPLMLPLLWTHPTLSSRDKGIWTSAIAGVTVVLGWVTVKAVRNILDYYNFIFQL